MLSRPLVFAAPLLLLLLAGCVPTDEPITSSTSATPTPTASTAAPTVTPTASASPAPEAIPLDIACGDLVSPQAFYDYNPNYSLLTDFTPDSGTAAARAVAAEGVACRWINQSSGDTIDISAAHLNDPTLADARAEAAASGSSTAEFDGEGYFAAGSAQAFAGAVWVTATSPSFTSPGDAAALVNAAVAAVG